MELDAEQHAALLAAGTGLWPGSALLPPAGSVELAALAEQVLKVAPDLRPAFQEMLNRLRDQDPITALRGLYREDTEGFMAFAVVVTQAYLMAPEVHRGLGYPGQTPLATPASEVPKYLHNGMLERVVERAKGPRLPPADSSEEAR